MGNLKQKHDGHNRKHGAAGKPHRGSAIFRTFIACVTAFTLMMPITATAAITDEETGFDPETTEAPAVNAVENDTGAEEGEAGDEPSDVDVDGEDASGDEAVSGDADKTSDEKAEGIDTDKDGKDAAEEDAEGKDGKDAKDKDAAEKDDKDKKDAADKASGKDKDKKDADGKAADKAPETAESKGSVIEEDEEADDEAADKKDADKKDDEAKKMPAQAFEASLTTENGESLTVHVKAPKGAFPVDTTMKVTSVQSEDVPEAVEKAVSARTDDAVVDMQAVDISFKDKDGKEIEPAKKVTVTFESDLISKDDKPMLVHVDDEGEANVLDPLSNKELKRRGVEANENELLVDSDEFSMYVLTLTGKLTADVLTADGKTYKITVTCDEDAQIPEDAELVVTEILSGTDEYQNYLDQAAEALGQENSEAVPFARFFDIEIRNAAGEKIEPAAPVQVKIELADAPETEQSPLQVVHFEGDEETPVVVETKADEEADVCFEAESFSTWAVLITNERPPSSGSGLVNGLDGWSCTISREGRYMTSELNEGMLGKTPDSSRAAVWTFEFLNDTWGPMYAISCTNPDGTKSYLGMETANMGDAAAYLTLAPLESGQEPTGFFVEARGNGAYIIHRYIEIDTSGNVRRYDLDEDYGSSGTGFHGYNHWTDNPGNNWVNLNFVAHDGAEPSMNDRATGTYAVIVKDTENNAYYSVQEDGSLMEVEEFDESTGVVKVKLGDPFAWTYQSAHDGLSDDTRSYNAGDDHPDWEPYNLRAPYDARGYNEGTQLKDGDYYRYISPSSESGTADESAAEPNHGAAKWNNAIRFENNTIHGIEWNGSGFTNTNKYIGADFENLHITGGVSEANAATVYLAELEKVPPAVDSDYSATETVNHIDIAIKATATLEFPLAYGSYYDADGNKVLTVTADNPVTITETQKVDITAQDIMDATLTAYDPDGGELDDAYYITGYSKNKTTAYSLDQVRMEGAFKVTTLDPYQGSIRANDDAQRRADRLKHEITYEITTKKDVSFAITYNGKQLYDNKGKPLQVDIKNQDFSANFSYWSDDENGAKNECPVVQPTFEENYSWMFDHDPWENINNIKGRNNRNWKAGAIIDNDWTNYMSYGDYPPYKGESGMDFILTANAKVKPDSVAVEIQKSIVDTNGEAIHPAETVTNTFTVYQSDTANPDSVANGYAVPPNEVADPSEVYDESYEQIGDPIEVAVGSEGVSDVYHDYDVAQGMVYVAEDPASIAQEIVDEDGVKWTYKETRVETEYVWRDDEYTDKRHVAENSSGVPDVLGKYTVGKTQYFNGFLEFYVYNVYEKAEPEYGDIEITKAVNGASPVETSCVVHLEGKTPAGEKYESYAEIAYGDGETGSVIVKHIPAGTKLTITEEYSGAGYDGDTKTLTATIVGGKTVTPDDGGQFVNSPNDDAIRGHGIQNNFELMENGDWEFTASQPVQSQSEDQE